MNRRELTCAIAAAMGAIAGAGCAAPQKSSAFVPEDRVAALTPPIPELTVDFLYMAVNYGSSFKRPNSAYAVSSTDDKVCSVHIKGDLIYLNPRAKGGCKIEVADPATGGSSRFTVTVI